LPVKSGFNCLTKSTPQNDDTATTSKPRPVVNVPRHATADDDDDDADNDTAADVDDDLLQTFWSGKGFLARPRPPTGPRPNKKRDDSFDRQSNEVIKHEASRMASEAAPSRPLLQTLLAIVGCVAAVLMLA
jgi:hypothetical protein